MWVALALTAGTAQAARNAFARSLAGKVSPGLNSWARFTFNLPFVTALVAVLLLTQPLPQLSWSFLGFCGLTAITQLLGNVALVAAFSRASFVESIVLHKLEIVFAALIGVALFSERPSGLGWAGVVVSAVGVLVMNLGRDGVVKGWRRAFHFDPGAVLALTCGVLLVLASFFLKDAATIFAELNPRVGSGRFEAAVHTLFHTTWIEVVILTVALRFIQPGEFALVPRYWRRMLVIGATGFIGSLCWFWAYSIAFVAYVKAVGQVESLLAIGLSVFVWRERHIHAQLPGVALVLTGILLVLLGAG